MSEPEPQTGRCLCGAVRFRVEGAPSRVLNCHCESCRRHTGAPMATLAVFQANQVLFSGTERKLFASNPGVSRSFCPDCGASLSWELVFRDEGPICALHVSAFDAPDALVPSAHTFYGERLCWFDAEDALPRYESFFTDGTLMRIGPERTS